MGNLLKKLKVIVVIAIVILLSVIAFVGVFTKDKGVWQNIIPDFKYGMDLEGSRELRYSLSEDASDKYVYVDDEGNVKGEVWKDGSATIEEAEKEADSNDDEENAEEVQTEENNEEEIPYKKETRNIKSNQDESLTKENFELSKKIIQKRLKDQDIEAYNIRMDNVTGKVEIDTENNDDKVGVIEDLIEDQGKFKIVDYQNGLVLMDNQDIKKASVVFSNGQEYKTYLQIEFNKEGAEKLREMSKKYVETVIESENEDEESEEVSEENESEDVSEDTENEEEEEKETEKKLVSIIFDDNTMMTTYFGEEMTAGMLQINVGEARTDFEEFKKDYENAKQIADILNSGILPIKYELETDNFIKSEFKTNNNCNDIIKVLASYVAVVSIVLIIRFKANGVIASILSIGFIAVFSIVARYTNILITENSFVSSLIMIMANYIFVKMLLVNMKNEEFNKAYIKTMKDFYLNTIPLSVIAIVFTFAKYTVINSIGMVVFWGMILIALYNFLFTRTVLKNK